MCHTAFSRVVPYLVTYLATCLVLGCGSGSAPLTSTDATNVSPSETVNSSESSEPPSQRANQITASPAVPSVTESAATSAKPGTTTVPSSESKIVKVDETPREPATVEEAIRVLDLRTLPAFEDAEFRQDRVEIGHLEYEVKADLSQAIKFHRAQLASLGWEELPDSRPEGDYPMIYLTKDGYVMQLFGSLSYDPDKKSQGYCSIGIYNYGNTPFSKLPVPESASPHYGMPGHPSYVTTDDTDATRAWCSESLLEAGWQPYGSASDMMYFKQNAIKLSAWVRGHESQPGKTFIDYSSELMSADLPLPTGVEDSQYVDSMGRLTFTCSNERFNELAKFYADSFAGRGWSPTTEPIKGDRTTSVVYRNAAGDIITLDMEDYNENSRISVTQQTAAQVAVLEQRLRDEAKRHAAKLAGSSEMKLDGGDSAEINLEAILKAELGKVAGGSTNEAKSRLEALAEAGDIAGLEDAIGDFVGGLLGGAAGKELPTFDGKNPVMEGDDVAATSVEDGIVSRIAEAKVGKCEGFVQRNDDKFAMHHAMAFQKTEFDELVTVVYVSAEPFRTKGLQGTTVEEMSLFRWQAPDSPPSMEMRIRGDSVSISCFVEGHSINIGGADFKSEAMLKDGKLQGKVFSPEPHEFFDDTFQFSILLDVDVMKTAETAAPSRLVADDNYEYPVAIGCNEVSSESSPYRTVIRGVHPAGVALLTDFYRTELAARGWNEDATVAKLTEDAVSLSFASEEETLAVQLRVTAGRTEFALAARNGARAKKDGIVAKPGKAKLMLANPGETEMVVSVDGREYKVAAGVGGSNPAEAMQIDIEPGTHSIAVKSGNEPPETEKFELDAGVTWAIVGFPGGGYLSERLY
ncbi:MAG: hypothetical protein H6822_21200 [Planctomycetaceae bacterium]|nr:hypothetical protein [Planctomycetales bacterium]MCB9924711.1 hypothetical protein [Planctomycetaceae bacterium]